MHWREWHWSKDEDYDDCMLWKVLLLTATGSIYKGSNWKDSLIKRAFLLKHSYNPSLELWGRSRSCCSCQNWRQWKLELRWGNREKFRYLRIDPVWYLVAEVSKHGLFFVCGEIKKDQGRLADATYELLRNPQINCRPSACLLGLSFLHSVPLIITPPSAFYLPDTC